MSIKEAKEKLAIERKNLSLLKARHQRSVELKAATCVTARSMERVEREIQGILRRYPALSGH